MIKFFLKWRVFENISYYQIYINHKVNVPMTGHLRILYQ